MFDELDKYNYKNHFLLKLTDNLVDVCNAPNDKSGVYILYALKDKQIELIYIGRSGEIKPDGSIFIRKTGLGGIKDRLVNGKQFGEARRRSWKMQMLKENIEVLDVYWYITHSELLMDCPKNIENTLLKKYFDIYGRLPKWNNKL